MSRSRATGPRVTGWNEDGRPRVRGSMADFLITSRADLEFREMGLRGFEGNVGLLTGSPKQIVERNRERGLRQAFDTERNSELVRGGLDRKANTVVGATLRPIPMPDLTWLRQDTTWMLDYQQQASSAFQEWGSDLHARCDAEMHYQFGGLMWQGFRTLSGPQSETCGYIGYDRARADRLGWKWGTFVNFIDPARLSNPQYPTSLQNGDNMTAAGNVRIADGRELDDLDAMQALWFAVRHPSEPAADPLRWERIQRMLPSGRAQAFHWFFKRQPGLQRALTGLHAVLSSVDSLQKFKGATLQNAIGKAFLATYLKTTMTPEEARDHLAPVDGDPEGRNEWAIKADAYQKMNLQFGSKRIPVLGPNDEIKFEGLEGAAIDFDPFQNSFLRELASALGISFEQLSLDFTKVSYSSARQSMIQAWANVMFERTMFSNHVACLVYDAVIEEAFALGILKEPPGAPSFYEARQAYTRCIFIGPGMGWVDPLKEINAAKGRVGLRVSTLGQEASMQGGFWADNMLQASLEQKYAEQLDLTIDTSVQGGIMDEPENPADPSTETPINQG